MVKDFMYLHVLDCISTVTITQKIKKANLNSALLTVKTKIKFKIKKCKQSLNINTLSKYI